jgi:hypothetical protein
MKARRRIESASGSRRTLEAFGVLLIFALTAAAFPGEASAQGDRYALIVQGASGEEQYAVLHKRWVDTLVTLFRDRFKYDAAHLIVLTEQPGPGQERATAEGVRAAIGRLTKTMGAADQLVVILIGHGSAQGSDAKFNLLGPDLSIEDWASLLKPVPGRLAVVDTTSASFPYLAGLAAPGRVVITATSTAAQRYHTVFPEGFVQALTSESADLDKNSRISLLEAFTYAARIVKQHYEQNGTMATELAVLDDDGDGKGRAASASGPDGSIAALTYLDAVTIPTVADPEVHQLLVRQRALTEQVDELRRRRTTMAAEAYDKELERLLTELATVSREVRRRTGN